MEPLTNALNVWWKDTAPIRFVLEETRIMIYEGTHLVGLLYCVPTKRSIHVGLFQSTLGPELRAHIQRVLSASLRIPTDVIMTPLDTIKK